MMNDYPVPQVVTIGETMIALVPEEIAPLRYVAQFRRRIAGAESNVAVGLVRLGISSGWISRVGDDDFGSYICTTLRGEGVDISKVERDPLRATGLMIKELRAGGKTRVMYYRAGSAASALSADALPLDYLRRARHLHLTGITPALSPECAEAAHIAARTVVEAGGRFSFDVNLRKQLGVADPLALFGPLLQLADTVFVGLDEASELFGTKERQVIEQRLVELGIATVLLKLGAKGASAYSAALGNWVSVPGYSVSVVDEVGAGDAFVAAYLAADFRGLPLEERLRFANAAGALTITTPGDIEGFAGWDELEQFMRGEAAEVQR